MNFDDLTKFHLQWGGHPSRDDGMCAMEAVAWLEGLGHTDHPACTSPVLAAFVRGVNDYLPTPDRQELIRYLPRLVDTVSPEDETARTELIVQWALTDTLPRALQRIGAYIHARALAGMPTGDWAKVRKLTRSAAKAAARTVIRPAADAGFETSVWMLRGHRENAAWSAARTLTWAARSDEVRGFDPVFEVLDVVISMSAHRRRPEMAPLSYFRSEAL